VLRTRFTVYTQKTTRIWWWDWTIRTLAIHGKRQWIPLK